MIVALALRKVSPSGGPTSELDFEVHLAVLGGYSARAAEVRDRHIEELREIGIEPSDRIPAFWPIASSLVVTDSRIEVQGNRTSGEIEFALLFGPGHTYVALASDQTDREFEVHSIPRSKQLCPKVVSADVIDLEELRSVWDDVVISSEVREADGTWSPYQKDSLASIMAVDEMLGSAFGEASVPTGTVLLSGTVPLLDGITKYASAFRGRLEVPGWDGHLSIEYEVTALPGHPTELDLSAVGGGASHGR